VLVVDACGVGALPDAADYGDEGTNTLAHVAQDVGGLALPSLQELGLGCILPLAGVAPSEHPAIHGRLHALGPGKDSTSGHWELMGTVVEKPLPSYPQGLPEDLLGRLAKAMRREVICNLPSNGITAIDEFGERHLESGALILYTSTDSVVQLAAHVDRVGEQELYAACRAAREVLWGEHAVGRVIARPFTGLPGAFARTEGRCDFTLPPPRRSYLQELCERGVQVHSVGKVGDLFAGVGISESHPGATNASALASAAALLQELDRGMIFVNLIETDQVYGHRKDVEGFHLALQAVDAEVGRWLGLMRPEDLLVITADHGVDPHHPSGDHTREYAPLLALTGAMLRASGRRGARHDGPLADVGASALLWLTGDIAPDLPGEPFIDRGTDA
jgi:phosphopentomutase